MDELKKITIEEWNKIPIKFIQKLFKNFIKRCKKIIELKGGRLEPVHLNQIRKEMEKEENEEKEKEINQEEKDEKEEDGQREKKNIKLKIVFSKKELIKKAKKEISFIRKKIKEKKKELRRAKKVYNRAKNYSKKSGKIFNSLVDKYKNKRAKNIQVENYKFRINWIKNYIEKNIDEYFNYFKKECKRQEDAKTYASTIDGEIEFKMKSQKEKDEFKKNQEFYSLEYHPKKQKKKINKTK